MFIYPRIYRKMKRGPQVILPKDIGIIIVYSGIDKNSVCVDAGTGSGWMAGRDAGEQFQFPIFMVVHPSIPPAGPD